MNGIRKQIEKFIELCREMVSFVMTWLNGIAKDKYQHYSLGAFIAAAIFCVTAPVSFIFTSHFSSVVFSLASSMVVVVATAFWKDYAYDESADKYDIRSTIAGGATVWLVIFLTLILY